MSSIQGVLLRSDSSRAKLPSGRTLIDRHRRVKNKPPQEFLYAFGCLAVSGSSVNLQRAAAPSDGRATSGPTSGSFEGERGAAPPEICVVEKLHGFLCEIPLDISTQRVLSVSTGAAHFLLLTEAGRVYARGDNRYGQLGLGAEVEETFELALVPLPDGGDIGKIDQIQCSGVRSAAIGSEGRLLLWGTTSLDGDDGRLDTVDRPTLVGGSLSATDAGARLFVIQVVLAAGHTAVLAMQHQHQHQQQGSREQRLVFTWGSNAHGQLGHGDRAPRATPTLVAALCHLGVKYLSSGPTHMAAISSSLRLYMWGSCYDEHGSSATAINYLGVPAAGPTVLSPKLMPHLKVVHRVRCGDGYTLAVCGMRACWAWGVNVLGCLGTAGNGTPLTKPTRLTTLSGVGIEALSVGRFHAVAQTRCDDGSLQYWSWGANHHGLLGQHIDAAYNPVPSSFALPDPELTVAHIACGETATLLVCRRERETADSAAVDGALEKGLTLVEFVQTSSTLPPQPQQRPKSIAVRRHTQLPATAADVGGSLEFVDMPSSFRGSARTSSRHQFVLTTFPSEAYCSFCRSFLWGLVHQGVQCKTCGFVSHTKCIAAANVHMPCTEMQQKTGEQMTQISDFGFDPSAPSSSSSSSSSSSLSLSSSSPISLLSASTPSPTPASPELTASSPTVPPARAPVSKIDSASRLRSVGSGAIIYPHHQPATQQHQQQAPVKTPSTAALQKRVQPPPPLPVQPMPSLAPAVFSSAMNLTAAPVAVAAAPNAALPPLAPAPAVTVERSSAPPAQSNLLIKIGLIDDPPMKRASAAWMSKTISITPSMSAQQAIHVLLQKVVRPLSEELRQATLSDCAGFSLLLARANGSRGQVIAPSETLWPRAQEGRQLFFTSSVEWLRDCQKRKKTEMDSVRGGDDDDDGDNKLHGTVGRKMGGWLSRSKDKKTDLVEARRQLAAKDHKIEELSRQLAQSESVTGDDVSLTSSSSSSTTTTTTTPPPPHHHQQRPTSQLDASTSTPSKSSSREGDDAFSVDIDPEQVEVLEFIAHGTAGDVYKGRYLFQDVAIKFLRDPTPELIEDFRQEIVLMRRIKTKQVVFFYGVTSKPKPCLVMEWCAFGSLMDVLRNPNETIGWNEFFSFGCQTLQSVYALHVREPPIVHRDLKTLNYLVDRYYCIKLCDFGLARTTQQKGADIRESLAEELGKTRGTYEYLAPEIYHGAVYSPKSDVYSLAIILWELAYRTLNREWMKPYGDQKRFVIPAALYLAIARQGLRPTIPDNCPPPLADMLTTYWTKDVDARPGIEKMMEDLLAIQKIYDANTTEWDAAIVHIEEPVDAAAEQLPTDDDDQLARTVSRGKITGGGEKTAAAEQAGAAAKADSAAAAAAAATAAADQPAHVIDLVAKKDVLLAQYKALMDNHPDNLDLFESMLRKLAEQLENPLVRARSVSEVSSEMSSGSDDDDDDDDDADMLLSLHDDQE